jgi:hypothetical protein
MAHTKKSLRAAWLKALRSGKYKQGTGKLRNKLDQYCCFGVVCDISGLGRWAGRSEDYLYSIESEISSEWLPISLSTLLDLDVATKTNLIYMNDKYQKTFTEIAAYLETVWSEENKT